MVAGADRRRDERAEATGTVTSVAAEQQPTRLWVSRYAAVTRMPALLGLLGFDAGDRDRYAPYAFIVALWTVVTLGFPLLRFARTGDYPLAQTPGMFVVLPAWLFVVYVVRGLDRRYRNVVDRLPDADDAPVHARHASLLRFLGVPVDHGDDALAVPVPGRLKRALLVPGLGLQVVWFLVDPDPASWLGAVWGPEPAWVFFVFVVPGVFIVFGVELVALYLGVHVLLPLTVTAQDRMDFSDHHRFGGLRPLGRLVRDSSASILALLTLEVLFETVSIQSSPLDPFGRILLLGGIAFGLVTFLLPVYWLHRFMAEKKAAKIRAIATEVAEGEGFPDIDPRNLDDFEFYTIEFIRLNRVENMKEFPVDLSLVVEFVLILLLPYLVEVSSELVL